MELTYCVVTHSEKTRDALAQKLQSTGLKTIASAEENSVKARLAAIADINDLLARHGLTEDDIR